jgi:DNA-binding CsgD family transcriptional regulator
VITDHSSTLTEFQTVSNAPADYLADFEDLELARVDPVSQHCKQSTAPIVWDRRTYASAGRDELWERQAQFGYRSGLAVAMHFPKGRHFLFGAEWDRERCEHVADYKEKFADLLTFAAHAQAAAFVLSIPWRNDTYNEWSVTNAELEALRWTMDGLTSWEVAKEMSISERQVALLLRQVMKKLGCSSKYETVLRAIQLKLIECP